MVVTALIFLTISTSLFAKERVPRVEVSSIRGKVMYSDTHSTRQYLKVGHVFGLHIPALRTEAGSEITFFISPSAGALKLFDNSEMGVIHGAKHSLVVHLKAGKISGIFSKVTTPYSYEVKGTDFTYKATGGEFEICASGNIYQGRGSGILLKGTNRFEIMTGGAYLPNSGGLLNKSDSTKRLGAISTSGNFLNTPEIYTPSRLTIGSSGPSATGLARAQGARGYLMINIAPINQPVCGGVIEFLNHENFCEF